MYYIHIYMLYYVRKNIFFLIVFFLIQVPNNFCFYFQNGESKPVPAEKRSSTDEKPKNKTLPELDKYWKVVNDDPTDFTGWTYLLQYVDQEVNT